MHFSCNIYCKWITDLVPKAIEHVNAYNFFVCLLTLSSSAVRLGVRIGACGRLGSLPRLGGRGFRGKPLHMSFKDDIPLSVFLSHTDQTGD